MNLTIENLRKRVWERLGKDRKLEAAAEAAKLG